MTENVGAWWARRQFSKGAAVPYAVGTYSEAWQAYPALIRQYHPDLNAFIVLTQIPPAADVYLTWLCDVGHTFVATPDEQRNRPGRRRRRSAWCPECTSGAIRTRIRPMDARPDPPATGTPPPRPDASAAAPAAELAAQPVRLGRRTLPPQGGLTAPNRAGATAEASTPPPRSLTPPNRAGATPEAFTPRGGPTPQRRATAPPRASTAARPEGGSRGRVGDAFHSAAAPRPASAAEARLRQLLAERLDIDAPGNPVAAANVVVAANIDAVTFDAAANLDASASAASIAASAAPASPPNPASVTASGTHGSPASVTASATRVNAVRVARPFFGRYEVWPDIVLPDLRVAIEYDTVGRFGLEHVGRREQADRRKDQLLRAAGWEVVRIRSGALLPLGPYDVSASTVSASLVDRVIDAIRAIRGDLIVDAYLAERAARG